MASGAIAVYSQAVTPQEGWYIAGEEFYQGKDYWILDNKKDINPWWINLWGGTEVLNLVADSYDGHDDYFDIDRVLFGDFWRGYSDTSWRIDNDWLICVACDSFTVNKGNSCQLIAWDRTRVPCSNLSKDFTITTSSSSGTVRGETSGNITYTTGISSLALFFNGSDCPRLRNDGDWYYYPVSDFHIDSFSGADSPQMMYNIDGTDINDLIIGVAATSYAPQKNEGLLANARIAIQFMVPKDKCPEGMAVGDYWPKVRPLEVEIKNQLEGIEQEYYKKMLEYSQLNESYKIGNMNKGLNNRLDNALALPNLDTDLNTNAIASMMNILGPLKQIFPWLIAGLFVVVVIRRGVT